MSECRYHFWRQGSSGVKAHQVKCLMSNAVFLLLVVGALEYTRCKHSWQCKHGAVVWAVAEKRVTASGTGGVQAAVRRFQVQGGGVAQW